MTITVQYLTQIRQAAGVDQELVDVPHVPRPATVEDLVRQVAARHGEPLRRLLLTDQQRVRPSLLVLVGDQQVRPDDPAPLEPQSVVSLMSPIAGG